MKKLLLFFLFGISFLSSFSQLWCADGAQWHFEYYNNFVQGYVEMYVEGDTIIDDIVAKKIRKERHFMYMPSMTLLQNDLGLEITYENEGVVFVRFENGWDTLYNMNASIGDSWKITCQPSNSQCFLNGPPEEQRMLVVGEGIKSINGENRSYKVIEYIGEELTNGFGIGQTDTIIDGIGIIGRYMFPMDNYYGMVDGNEGGNFRCYSDNVLGTYHPNANVPCEYIVSVAEFESGNPTVIFPIPASDALTIQSPNQFDEYVIYNHLGKMIIHRPFSSNINVSTLPNGIYVIQLHDGKSIIRKTFQIVK